MFLHFTPSWHVGVVFDLIRNLAEIYTERFWQNNSLDLLCFDLLHCLKCLESIKILEAFPQCIGGGRGGG